MTFTHLMNCAALTYGPIYMVYSGASLSENSIFSFSLWSIFYYSLSSLIKMVLYATVIPYHMIESEVNIITQDALKITINLIELVFLSYSLKAKNSFASRETSSKILAVALSWALADSIASNLLYFLMEATGEEFKWEFIQAAIQSNFDLVFPLLIKLERIATVSLMSCVEKLRNVGMWNIHIIFVLIIKFFASGLLFKYISFFQFENSWEMLFSKGAFAFIFAITAKIFYSKVNSNLKETHEEEIKTVQKKVKKNK